MGKRAAAASSEKKTAKASKVALPSSGDVGSSLQGASKPVLALSGESLQKHLDRTRLVHQVAGVLATDVASDQTSLPAFDESQAILALKSGEKSAYYVCSMNLAWLDPAFSPCPAIPVSQNAIQRIHEHWFANGPAGLESQSVVVTVLKAEVDAGKMPAFGTWRLTSAMESIIAFYLAAAACAEKVQNGATDSAAEMDKWTDFLLSCPVTIKVAESFSDLEWLACQYREDKTQLAYLQLSPVQRVFDIQAKKEHMGMNYTPQALIDLYTQKVKFSSKSEQLTLNFISQCQVVYDRGLCNRKVLELLLEDEKCNEPLFDKLGKIHACLCKTQVEDEIAWVFEFILDQGKAKTLPEQSLTLRFLAGSQSTHHKGYVDLALYKLRLKQYFLGEFMSADIMSMPDKYKDKLRDVFSSVQRFRGHVGYPDRQADLTWKCGWPASADACLEVFQDNIKLFWTTFHVERVVINKRMPKVIFFALIKHFWP